MPGYFRQEDTQDKTFTHSEKLAAILVQFR